MSYKRNNNTFFIFVLISLIFLGEIGLAQNKKSNIIANPLNLNYRFQLKEPSRREAADPVLEYFKGKYYLFASKSGGYWSSPDLVDWKFIPTKTISTIEHYAPAIMVMNDTMYFMSSTEPKIYKNSNPEEDKWEEVGSKFEFQIKGSVDPAFFLDEDGKVYIYWGCSDVDPIIGVEVDPKDKFRVIGEAKILIEHHPDKYGWEVKGANNHLGKAGYNEGPAIVKHKGKYYLQYAAPGTEVRVYGDGLYVSDYPLGPYSYVESSPFSFKPGGFIGGAGHGHTFKDKYGNYWHVATMKISERDIFERRIGIFPAYITDDGLHAHTVFTDYPFQIPQRKINVEKDNLSVGWNLLSYRKEIEASSYLSGYDAKKANDEQVETWWAAKTGNAGEWLKIDLGKVMEISAVQTNFADHDVKIKGPEYLIYQYVIECSDNDSDWKTLVDRQYNKEDKPHDLHVLNQAIKTRYIRIKNTSQIPGSFSVYDLRVFGKGLGSLPPKVSQFQINRNDSDQRIIKIQWEKQPGVTGYIVNWGIKAGELRNATMVFDNHFEGRYFNRDSPYYFSIDTFNENGVSKGKIIKGTVK